MGSIWKKWYVGTIIDDYSKLPSKLRRRRVSKNRFVPLQFLSDGLFSLIKKENIKEFGIDENTDLERSLTDSVGYNEAMRVLKEKERDANTCRAPES